MSRWKTPQAAARQAERGAREVAKRRREKRIGVLLVVCWVVVSFGLCVADYLWMRQGARQRQEQHERVHLHRKQIRNTFTVQTNQTGVSASKRKS